MVQRSQQLAHAAPGTVKTELPIGLPRMRDPLRVEFLDYQRAVIAHLTGHPEGR